MAPEQQEKEDAARVARQRPVIRVCAELALVGVIRDAPSRITDHTNAHWRRVDHESVAGRSTLFS